MKIIVFLVLVGVLSTQSANALATSPTFTIRLEYFSGRRSPEWKVEPTNPNYAQITQLYTNAQNKQLLFFPKNMPSKLGYRGLIVNYGSTKRLVIGMKTKPLQTLLLESAPKGQLSPKILKNSRKAIDQGVNPVTTGPRHRRAPAYPDASWNDMRVRECNNCYNYATDIKSLPPQGFGMPGLGGGQVYVDPITPNDVRDAAVRDRLQETPAGNGNAIPVIPQVHALSRHLVALVVAQESVPGADDDDFHWYRLDNNGGWSHKPGATAVTNQDGNNQPINDPRNAANHPYGPNYQFVCFMTVTKGIATIEGYPDPYCY